MLHGLRLSDETATFDVSGNTQGIRLVRYTPLSPDQTTVGIDNLLQDGGEVYRINRRNITETVNLYAKAANPEAANAILDLLQDWLMIAEYRQNSQRGKRLFVEFNKYGTNTWRRSEILVARLFVSERAINDTWEYGFIELSIIWTRRFYWEAITLLEIPLVSALSGSTAITGGVTINGVNNAVDLLASNLTGTLPFPIKLAITNLETNQNLAWIKTVFVSLNTYRNPLTFPYVLEGESASWSNNGTVGNDTSFHGGQAITVQWTGTGETQLFQWLLSSDLLQKAQSRTFRIMMTTGYVSSTILFFWRLRQGLTPIYDTQPFLLNEFDKLQNWHDIPLPPYIRGLDNPVPLTLELRATAPNGGTNSLTVDWLQLSALDGWRELTARSYGADNT